jgi:hypothetical protein
MTGWTAPTTLPCGPRGRSCYASPTCTCPSGDGAGSTCPSPCPAPGAARPTTAPPARNADPWCRNCRRRRPPRRPAPGHRTRRAERLSPPARSVAAPGHPYQLRGITTACLRVISAGCTVASPSADGDGGPAGMEAALSGKWPVLAFPAGRERPGDRLRQRACRTPRCSDDGCLRCPPMKNSSACGSGTDFLFVFAIPVPRPLKRGYRPDSTGPGANYLQPVDRPEHTAAQV